MKKFQNVPKQPMKIVHCHPSRRQVPIQRIKIPRFESFSLFRQILKEVMIFFELTWQKLLNLDFKFNFLLQKEFRSLWFFSKNIESWKKLLFLTFFFEIMFSNPPLFTKNGPNFTLRFNPPFHINSNFPALFEIHTINECHWFSLWFWLKCSRCLL